jgi:hypothetical protein
LREDVVPIRYGMPMLGFKEWCDASDKYFPFSNMSLGGGCIIRDPKRARVLFCSKCREAERAWQEGKAGYDESGHGERK